MKFLSIYFSLIICVLVTFSCTDVITIETEPVEPQLVVDAWINDLPGTQTIRLTMSQPYFDNSLATGVTGAEVAVIDDGGRTFVFESRNNGDYVWEPENGESIGSIGTSYQLSIDLDDKRYQASSVMRRVPPVDSIVTEFREAELGLPEGMYGELFARDFTGIGDTYWIKTFKNGQFLNKGFEINIAYDAGFDQGGQVDGIIFIPPIRDLVNRVPDPDTEDDADVPPYEVGDSIRVEIHSINPEAFSFLEIARDQINNGANTIFSIPLANARGNIRNAETGDPALGMFNVAAVTVGEKVVD